MFTYETYATTFYHQSEHDITNFACPEFWFDLGRVIPTWFQFLNHVVTHILPCLGNIIHPFILYKHVWGLLVHKRFFYYMKYNSSLFVTLNGCLKYKNIYVHSQLSDYLTGYNHVPVEFTFSSSKIRMLIFTE